MVQRLKVNYFSSESHFPTRVGELHEELNLLGRVISHHSGGSIAQFVFETELHPDTVKHSLEQGGFSVERGLQINYLDELGLDIQ